MADQRVQLGIDVDNRDAIQGVQEIGKATKRTATTMERDLNKVTQAQKRVGAQAQQTSGAILEVGKDTARVGGLAGNAFSTMGAGFSAATAGAESLGGAVVSSAGAMAASFAAGGPAMLAISGVAFAVGGLISLFGDAGDEAEESAEQAAMAWKDVQASISSTARELGAIRGQLTGGGPGTEAQAFVAILAARQRLQDLERRSTSEAMTGHRAEMQTAREARQIREDILRIEEALRQREAERVRDAKAAAQAERERTRLLQEEAAAHRSRLQALPLIAEMTARAARDEAKVEAHNEAIRQGLTERLRLLAEMNRKQADRNRAIERERAMAERTNRSLDERLALMRAENDFERQRIALAQELQRLREQGADAAKLEELQRLRLAEIQERELAATKEQLAVEKGITAEHAAQGQGGRSSGLTVRQRRDPSRSIQNFGGAAGGLFGSFPGRSSRIQGYYPQALSLGSQGTNRHPSQQGAEKAAQATKELQQRLGALLAQLAKMVARQQEMADSSSKAAQATADTMTVAIEKTRLAIRMLQRQLEDMKRAEANAQNIGVAGA